MSHDVFYPPDCSIKWPVDLIHEDSSKFLSFVPKFGIVQNLLQSVEKVVGVDVLEVDGEADAEPDTLIGICGLITGHRNYDLKLVQWNGIRKFGIVLQYLLC